MSKRNYLSVVSTGVVAFGTLALGLVSVLPVASAANATPATGACAGDEVLVNGNCVKATKADELNKIEKDGTKAEADRDQARADLATARTELANFAEKVSKQADIAKEIRESDPAKTSFNELFAKVTAPADATSQLKLQEVKEKNDKADKAFTEAQTAYNNAKNALTAFVTANYGVASEQVTKNFEAGKKFAESVSLVRNGLGYTPAPKPEKKDDKKPVDQPKGDQTKTPEAGKQQKVKKGHHKFGAPNTGYEF